MYSLPESSSAAVLCLLYTVGWSARPCGGVMAGLKMATVRALA